MIRTIEFRAMNTTVMLAAEGERAIEGMEAAKFFIDECEQRFSRFLPASELSALNRSNGEWMEVSKDLMEMLQLALKYHEVTDGIFDPAILVDLKRAGYDRSMDEIRVTGAASSSAPSRTSRPAFGNIELDPSDNRVRLPRGLEIDLGGIAKGWIVDRATQLLNQYVPVCGVSAGGDILFRGRPADGMDWDVYLEDPRDPTRMLAQLHIPSGAVATSSVMKRSWRQGEAARHHLIDPRTREPARTEWLSVTVICPTIIEADVYAKTILIGGWSSARKLLNANPALAFIAVDPNGNLIGSSNYKEYIYEPATDLFLSTRITQ
ncbi:MAG: FAD:protein FMN transferase [Byssovorax cruenta]